MKEPLFETAPDFDQPIAVLKHCHDRIRKQLRTMEALVVHLPKDGQSIDAQQAAKAVLRYFGVSARHHHEDEEHDLLPMLSATASGADTALLNGLIPDIQREHRQMETSWACLEPQLQAIATGVSDTLSATDVRAFCSLYADHMEKEETSIAPMAKRIFSSAQMATLGGAMRARRGIGIASEIAGSDRSGTTNMPGSSSDAGDNPCR